VSLNEQATDPKSHTPVRRIYTLWEVLRHLLKSHGRPPSFLFTDRFQDAELLPLISTVMGIKLSFG